MLGFARKFSRLLAAVGGVTIGLTIITPDSRGADLRLSGNVIGSVVNDQGAPQMAAEVQLFDHLGKLARRALSSMDGRFAFPDLPAESYSVQVSLADYLPARLDSVVVKAGMNSILDIHLTTLLSSIQLTYTVPTGGMSKDWKWVLRSSPATRPINRFQPDEVSVSQDPEQRARVFSGTHAVVSVSGGGNSVIDTNPQNDVGTGFFLSTNILQKNQLQVGGRVAQSAALLPAAMGLCAIYSRKGDGTAPTLTPEVTFTVSQLGLIAGAGLSSSPGQNGTDLPAVRTMSLSVYQVMDVGGLTRVEYGVTDETVDYLGYSTRVSPFVRTTTPVRKFGEVIASYSDGARPDELLAHQEDSRRSDPADGAGTQLIEAVNGLSHLPQLSYRNGRLELQRTQSFELGYKKTTGNRSYGISAFAEDVSNGRVDVSGDTSLLNSGNLMSAGSSTTSVYNIGRYKRTGLIGSVNQQIKSMLDLSLAYGRMGGLSTASGAGIWSQSGTLGSFLEEGSHNVADAAVSLRTPKTFTRINANYGWTDGNAVIPTHVFTTQDTWISPGLNVMVKQPLPSLFGMPGHMELSADLQNLLAQGYLPVNNTAGRSLLVVQTPRAIRGSLNFIF